MSDDPKPYDDLREGLGLIFRAARKASERLNTTKVDETVAKGAKGAVRFINQVGRTIGAELEKVVDSPKKSQETDDTNHEEPAVRPWHEVPSDRRPEETVEFVDETTDPPQERRDPK
jgi:hypothetical protein